MGATPTGELLRRDERYIFWSMTTIHATSVDFDDIAMLADTLVESHVELMRALVSMRKRHSLTQEQVAERMSVSQPTVAAFERYDANPTLSTVRRYALAVGASIAHDVVDACTPLTSDRFEAVVAGNVIPWPQPRKQSATWSWSPAPLKAAVGD